MKHVCFIIPNLLACRALCWIYMIFFDNSPRELWHEGTHLHIVSTTWVNRSCWWLNIALVFPHSPAALCLKLFSVLFNVAEQTFLHVAGRDQGGNPTLKPTRTTMRYSLCVFVGDDKPPHCNVCCWISKHRAEICW